MKPPFIAVGIPVCPGDRWLSDCVHYRGQADFPFSDKQLGYVFAVSCFALLATFLFLACFGMTKERVGEEEEETPRQRCGKC